MCIYTYICVSFVPTLPPYSALFLPFFKLNILKECIFHLHLSTSLAQPLSSFRLLSLSTKTLPSWQINGFCIPHLTWSIQSFWNYLNLVLNLGSTTYSLMSLDKLFSLSVIQYPHLQNRDNNSIYLIWMLCGLHGLIHIIHLGQILGHSKHNRNACCSHSYNIPINIIIFIIVTPVFLSCYDLVILIFYLSGNSSNSTSP